MYVNAIEDRSESNRIGSDRIGSESSRQGANNCSALRREPGFLCWYLVFVGGGDLFFGCGLGMSDESLE